MRFQAGQWVEDDGSPVDPESMLTASQGPGPSLDAVEDDTDTRVSEPAKDPRKTKTVKRDPRKNRGGQ